MQNQYSTSIPEFGIPDVYRLTIFQIASSIAIDLFETRVEMILVIITRTKSFKICLSLAY